MDNVETQTYDADGTAEALTTNYMEIQDSDDEGLGELAASRKPLPPAASNPLAAEPPVAEAAELHEAPEPLRPPPVEEQGQVELPPKARAEVKQILAEVWVSECKVFLNCMPALTYHATLL